MKLIILLLTQLWIVYGSGRCNIPAVYKSTPFGVRRCDISDEFDYARRRSNNNDYSLKKVETVSSGNVLLKNMLRGSFLRIASDLSGGTVLENIKTRVTVGTENMVQATKSIVDESGILALWGGTSTRTIEGALIGALFLVGSTSTKKFMAKLGCDKSISAVCGGLVGGVLQAIVMTPTGLVFTSLNVNKNKPGYENENAFSVCKRIIEEKGMIGMYAGSGPMVLRQATNWASRSGFTEIARNALKMSQYGLLGEIGSGVIGGLGSCWNTPIETVRVLSQRDASSFIPPKTFGGYTKEIVERDGIPGLFRGIVPRGVQAIWQTVFMVVFPNMLGM